ncbi:MAG: L-histidine N(alpha)-methyltransferase [Pirellulaceae bacterium]
MSQESNLDQESKHLSNDQTTVVAERNPEFLRDVVEGLSLTHKSVPCKYLYDERGSKLFDRICELDEYYPTRTEQSIMNEYAEEIAAVLGVGIVLAEFGSGSSTKTRVLLNHLKKPVAYVPIDISEDHLFSTADTLQELYPDLTIRPVVADFSESFELPEICEGERVCVYFPGSTIGNFEPDAAHLLLKQIAQVVGPGGELLIGFDLKKSKAVLEAAYDDAKGVTAAFSLNILRRMNQELDADFDLASFAHVSHYNEEAGRIEIYIESLDEQQATIGEHTFRFAKGERIHTEYSHKYTIDGFTELAESAGFECSNFWTDPKNYFAVKLLTVA